MKYYVMCGLLCGALSMQASAQPVNNPGQGKGAQQMTEAQLLAAEKQARNEAARVRHQARFEEERAVGKTTVPIQRRYSLR